MGFLNLSLYGRPDGKSFDPDKVVQKVKAAFPEATQDAATTQLTQVAKRIKYR